MKLVNIHTLGFLIGLAIVGYSSHSLNAQVMTLQQCVDEALAGNRNLQAGRNDLQLGLIRQQEAKSNLMPKLTTAADYKYFINLPYQLMPLSVFNGPEGQYKEAQFGVPHNLAVNVQLAMPLYNPQMKAGVKSAEIASEISHLQVEKAEEQVIFEVTALYYNAQILQHQLLFADSNLINVNLLFASMQLMQTQGLAKGTDIDKIDLQKAQLLAQRTQLEGRLLQLLNGLNFVMGRELATPMSVSQDIEPGNNEAYPVSTSVDARMIQVQNRLLVNELDILKKANGPTVSLLANYGLTGFGYFRQPDPFFKIFPIGFIGAQAAYPIWNKTPRHKMAQKEVEITSNQLKSEQVQAQNNLQLANAVVQKNSAAVNIPVLKKQIALAESGYRQTLLQQRQGTASIADILLADNALREAQTQYLLVLVEYLKADLELKKASGSIKQ